MLLNVHSRGDTLKQEARQRETERERERTRDEASIENHRDKEHTKSCFFFLFPPKTAQQKPSTRDVLSVPWTRSMDNTWELVNEAGSRRTPSQIY